MFKCQSQVLEGAADIGLTTDPMHPELSFLPLFQDALCFVCRDDHSLASYEQVTWEQVHQYANIGVSEGNSLRQLTEGTLTSLGLSHSPDMIVSHTLTMLGMVANGFGASVSTKSVSYLNNEKRIKFITIISPVQYRVIGLLKKKSNKSSLIDDFYQSLQKQVEASTRLERRA
ncbi:LysR substrate-binding domain-containing protein [Vibrio sp.]|nr:LysR substrate-binding domain-containing protein [Vibrio sp.]